MKILIASPSYKRANNVKTLRYITSCLVFVDEGEYGDYCKYNRKENIVSVPKGIQGNVARIRNYILDWAFNKD